MATSYWHILSLDLSEDCMEDQRRIQGGGGDTPSPQTKLCPSARNCEKPCSSAKRAIASAKRAIWTASWAAPIISKAWASDKIMNKIERGWDSVRFTLIHYSTLVWMWNPFFFLVTFRRANFQGVNLLAKFVKKKIKGRCRQIETLTPPQ